MSQVKDDYMDLITQIVSKKKKNVQNDEMEVKKLYETVNTVVSKLDESIHQCKLYNEAKIHRKYEIMIADLRKRISFLEQKIKEEHHARSPSKKYVQDLLDKLISYKFENEGQAKRIEQLIAQNKEMSEKIKIYEQDTVNANNEKEQNQGKQNNKSKTNQNINVQITGPVLKNQVMNFVKLKQNLRRHEKQEKTSFERFLKKNQDKLENWTMRQLLQAVEKWTVQFYQSQLPKAPKQTRKELSREVKNTSNTFRMRSKKTISCGKNLNNNLTLYENILR